MMNDDDVAAMTKRVRRLVSIAAGGRIDEADLADENADLRQMGLDSLGYLNLLEGLERTFGVAIDLDQEPDHRFLHTIGNLTRFLMTREPGRAA
jgi:acyl carrier protein